MAWLVTKGISAFTLKLDMEIRGQLTFGHAQLAFPFLSSTLLQPVVLLLGHLHCRYLNPLKGSFWVPLGMSNGDLPERLQACPTC